jgi:hypothetical protein
MNTNFVINTSRIRGYKNKLLGISLIAMFAISILMAFAPAALAQPGVIMPRRTIGYISVAPLVIGVGQEATVNAWISPLPVGYSGSAWYGSDLASVGKEPGFLGVSVTFTRPDGTTDTFMPTDPFGDYMPGQTETLGILTFHYAPNMAGNWSVTMSATAQNFTDSSGTVLYTATSPSSPAYFTVTTEQQNAGLLNGWPYSPLPNDNVYWNYPINSNNREWASIAAIMYPQTGGGTWQPYGLAPSSPHIVWQLQDGNGGLIGSDMGGQSLTGYGSTPIILMGKAYINGINALGGANCYDLTTGKLLWESNNTVSNSIFLPGTPYNQAVAANQNTEVVLESSTGVTAYLFGTSTGATIKGLSTQNWNYIEPLTGRIAATFTNATMGTGTMTNGSPLVFGSVKSGQTSTPPYYMNVNYVWGWNRSKVVGNDWYTGLMWTQNVSRHWGGVHDPGPGDGVGRTQGFVISADMSTIAIGGSAGNYLTKGFSTTDGHSVWNVSLGYVGLSSSNGLLYGTNNFVTYESIEGTYRCYSILTGALLWTVTNAGTLPWYTQSYNHANDANNMYINSIDGTIIAIDLTDGHKVWQSKPIPTTEMIFNNLPAYQTPIVAGGFVYQYLGYATSYQINPLPRGAVTACFNATTGETVWTLNGGNNPVAAFNGYLFTSGIFSGMKYCIGKGQTSTSVTVPNNFNAGTTVQIQGNVLDQSPAQPDTPAVSEASMSEWMDYLHMQNATLLNSPPSPLGVQVTLTAIDPNNNCVTIGTTTTDSAGNYLYDWTPTITGDYRITTSFAGSKSYWPSSSETSTVVTEAHATPAPTTDTSTSVADMYFVPAIAGLFVLIIIVLALVVLLMLRKRP